MLSKFDKTNPFKNAKVGCQLNPSYLYDIDLITQTKSWIKLDVRHHQSAPPKKN